MKKTIKKSYLFIAMLTVMIVLLSSVIMGIFVSPNKIFVNAKSVADLKNTNAQDLYNSTTGNFNKVVMDELLEKLFGNNDPIKYIKTMTDSQTGSYVIPASTINAEIGNSNGLNVMLGGKEWTAASLTLADIAGEENAVLTLLLAEPDGTSIFYSDNSNIKGNNAYSRSIVRNHLLTDEKWSLFNQTGEGSFASQFLVQPKNIKYQHTESQKDRGTYASHLPNEALDDFTTGWNDAIYYNPSDTFTAPDGSIVRYDAWGNDYIWIPSMSETGSVNRPSTTSLWELSSAQLAYSNGTPTSWFRSADVSGYAYVYTISPNGNTNAEYPKAALGVRPAIHLNLSSIAQGIDNPQDLTTSYNENEQTVKSIATATKADWYNKDIYEHADNYISISYSNEANYVKDAGEYWARIEITQNYLNAINKQIDDEGAEKGWSADYIAQVKERRKPRFRGTADTTDRDHLESDTVRWIKITINKAEIDFSNVKWGQSEFEYNGQNQKVEIASGLPSFLTAVYDNNAKSAVGDYIASVIDFTGSDPNYKTYTSAELANIPQLKHNWKITKKKVAVSWTKKNVTIGDITLPIPRLQVAENLANAIEYKYFRKSDLTDEVTLEQIFAENDISEIKSYYIQAIFTTNTIGFNNTNCIFVVDGNEENSVSEVFQTGSVINKVEVSLKNNKFTYNGLSQAVELNVAGGGLTASNLVISYTTADGTPLSGAPTNVGRYKVLVGLQSGLDDFMIVGEDTFDYEIESLKIRKPKADQVNIFDAEGFGLSAVANMPTNWKSYFEITVDGNVVDENYKFTKAGKYSIQIAFKNGVNTANGGEVDNVVWEDRDNTTYTITLDIQTLEFEISGWQNGTGNKRPTLLSDEKSEIEKYFDYEIYQVKDGQIIGNVILPTATLKYDTNYQISLKVKNEYKGSVYLKYNGELVDETETYSFKTEVNPNPSGGDGEDDNNGTDGKPNGGSNGGMDSFVEDIKNMPSYLKWIFIGIIVLLILLIILIIILLIVKSSKNKNTPQQAIPYAQYAANNGQQAVSENNGAANANTEDIKPKEVVNIRGTIVNNYKVGYKDWTFVIKENDVLNLSVLEAPQERILFYALKESEAKKVKKLQNQITPADGVDTDKIDEDSKPNSKLNKKKRRK